MSDGIQPAVLSPTKGRSRASGAPAPVVVAHRSGTLLDGVQSFCRMLEVPRADEKEGGDDTGTQLIAPLISAHVGGERVAMAWVRPSPGAPVEVILGGGPALGIGRVTSEVRPMYPRSRGPASRTMSRTWPGPRSPGWWWPSRWDWTCSTPR